MRSSVGRIAETLVTTHTGLALCYFELLKDTCLCLNLHRIKYHSNQQLPLTLVYRPPRSQQSNIPWTHWSHSSTYSASLRLPKQAIMGSSAPSDVLIEVITQPEDFHQAAEVAINAFGHQVHDGVYIAMTPGWDTPEGVAASGERLAKRWRSVSKDVNGRPNTIFLKATVPDPENSAQRRIAGLAIWMQASAVEGHGEPQPTDLKKALGLESLYPGNEAEQRYLAQCIASLQKQRAEVIKQTATKSPPAVFVLDLCAVDPKFQGRGAAKKLVQWGLEEAQRRGGIECILEGSAMGRHVYSKLGFKQEGPEIEYVVDEEFANRDRPSNIFMRTGNSQ
ncbi:GNAT family protein [Colletotrichum truncatum]|uniref:GNAT family protein n=1 Tax=Colletotrichum truncatum TaxID=5467 RepID=A0ACC3ZLE0_COLTU|nr:GNAT family protein [Colletotrichum truncatum]XP_036581610.1 GNAT family protein [Colletotrichum truncatum]KAF6783896.1 GNAT family protein [Colletotrichum truncatum]KAF6789961.1 GNAT family protein [Colletotrichum truncatum]